MSSRLEKASQVSMDKAQRVFDRRKVLFQLEHAQSAMEQDNFYVALSKQMKRTRKVKLGKISWGYNGKKRTRYCNGKCVSSNMDFASKNII